MLPSLFAIDCQLVDTGDGLLAWRAITMAVNMPCRFFTDAGVKELHLLAKLSTGASLGSRLVYRSCPSMSAIFSPAVTGDALRPVNKLSPAGPPPTQTTSYMSGDAEFEAHLRRNSIRLWPAGLARAGRTPSGSRGGITRPSAAVASVWGSSRCATPNHQLVVSCMALPGHVSGSVFGVFAETSQVSDHRSMPSRLVCNQA